MLALQNENTTLTERVRCLEEHLEVSQQNYQQLMQKLPNTAEIIDAVQNTISKKTPATTDNTPALQDENIKPTSSQVHTQQCKKKLRNNAIRHTLIIKGKEDITCNDIDKTLQQNTYISPIQPNNISRKRNCIEIECNTINDLNTLKNDIHRHQDLNKTLQVVPKTLPQQKMILLNVPTHTPEETIKAAITTRFEITAEEINILKTLQNRRNDAAKDLILLIPKTLGHSIIEDGGLIIGFKSYFLKPHTTVPRCRRCQSLKHTEKHCKSELPTCANCAENHDDSNCSKPPCCINCHDHNKKERTHFNTQHQASDSTCTVYRRLYKFFRRQLDEEFTPTSSYTTSAPQSHQQPPTLHRQQFAHNNQQRRTQYIDTSNDREPPWGYHSHMYEPY